MNEETARRLAVAMAVLCVRNTCIEDIHTGIAPHSPSGDFCDVKVVTPVQPVLEEMRQRADAEADAATHMAIRPNSRLGADAAPVEVLDEGSHRSAARLGTDRTLIDEVAA